VTASLDIDLDRQFATGWQSRMFTPAALASAAIGLALARFIFAGTTALTNDEAYYRLWSLKPALSYFDHPPFVAWLIALGRAIAGDTPLGARFLGPSLLLLGSLIHWNAALRLTDRETAIYAGWFFLAMPLLAIGGVIITPDLPSVVFYGLVLLGLDALARSQNANWWYAIGISAGCGALAKYTNLFAGLTIVVWLMAVPENRKWIRSPQLWIGGALAVIVFAPVLIWNTEHQWASFAKQFARIQPVHSIKFGHYLDFLGSFIGLASPLIAVLALIGLAHVTSKAFRTRDSYDVLLAAAILPMLGYFLVHALHGRVMPNWPAPLYPPFTICAAIGLQRFVPRSRQVLIAATATLIGLASTALIFAHAKAPFMALARDPTGEMRGWPAFSASVQNAMQKSGTSWIVTSDFQSEGQLSYAFKARVPVVQLDEQIRYENLPRVANDVLNQAALYVDLKRFHDRQPILGCFFDVDPLGTITRDDGTTHGAEYAIYRVKGLAHGCRPSAGFGAETTAESSRPGAHG
jgi:hypothetical protein